LGLSTVYGIVRGADGHISVESTLGRGSTFEILLPLARGPITRELSSPLPTPRERADETVLLLEDEDAVRHAVRHYLESAGYRVLEAKHGAEALQWCRDYSAGIDVLLTDTVLPQMSSDEAAREVKRLKRGVRVLFMSAHAPEWLRERGLIDGAVETLQKPFGREQLLQRVRALLDAPRGDA
ncbi:MAG: response regulator, partial [Myxococcales bacterium]|nr:response regulator [Myxococcales bacterium]